ncbi:Cupredoxin [Ampelomyces quisqualis]|uniref:Cupredoxin n=1 Tax=Ampelomyces quisqualis TaxID=50730 RepID=A0A6A5QRQ9_AMPQU|nr:Cupredoxin [Ampelomyces quisqualis]
MLFTSILAAAAFSGAAIAENHVVAVANKTGALVFVPDTVNAAEGDTVTFKFWPKNHSVAQSTFAQPCTPSNNGFWSGFVPTTDSEKVANWTFTYEVRNASAPVWFYCSQGRHCQSGMVGVINPPRSGPNTLAAYKNASSLAQSNVSPSSVAGSGGELAEGSNSSQSGAGSPQGTSAASHLAGSAAFAGLTSFFAYLLI